jgi:hypothetical protein
MLWLGMQISEFLVTFLSHASDMVTTSGLAECAKAVNKTNLLRRLLITCNNSCNPDIGIDMTTTTNQAIIVEWPDGCHSSVKGT